MKDIKNIHIEAMKLAKIADEYLLSHQEALFVKFTSDAFMLEKEAAQALIDKLDKEPTRGILCRSAATLAYNIGLFQEAKEIINVGLSGKPFSAIHLELEELQTKVETAIKENYSAEKVINDLKDILSNSSTIEHKRDNEQKTQQREVKSEHGIPEAASQCDPEFVYNAADERKKYARRIGIRRVAAAVLVLIISGILWIYYVSPSLNKKSTMQASHGQGNSVIDTVVVVRRGREDSVSLTDGSTIHINSDSRMEVQFTKSSRKVDFRGEAYFNVAPDGRPFIITTSYTTIEVLGTAFNVNTYDSGVTRILLVNGKVRVKALNKEVIVREGEELVYRLGETFQLRSGIGNMAPAWQQGVEPFFAEDLKSIATRLERVFDTCIVIDDERLLDSNFTGVIDRSIGLRSNLTEMQTIIKLKYYFSGDTLHITSK